MSNCGHNTSKLDIFVRSIKWLFRLRSMYKNRLPSGDEVWTLSEAEVWLSSGDEIWTLSGAEVSII